MKWIVGAGKDIVQKDELRARSEFIEKVTRARVTPWEDIQLRGGSRRFFICVSEDKIDGTFITAHIGDVALLSSMNFVADSEFVVANTCIWEQLGDKEVLHRLTKANPNAQLWFAKQELSVENGQLMRQSNLLSDVGNFKFPTSRSERILFAKRKSGFMNALRVAFERVSPVLLPKDYGGMGWEILLRN